MPRNITSLLMKALTPQGEDDHSRPAPAGSPAPGTPSERYHSETSPAPDAEEAASTLEQAAAAGDPEANLLLGNRFRHGDGVTLDLVAAWNHYVAAARGGNLEAMTNLGVMYDQGQTVPVDPAKAIRCYRFAADHGFAVAQYNLAIMYAEGVGVERSRSVALEWFGRAAAQGYRPAVEAFEWLSARSELL